MKELMYKITGHDDYTITNTGKLYGKRNNLLGTKNLKKDIMIKVSIDGKSKLLAHLVAEYFLPKEKDKEYVDFIDGNCLNCNVTNLRWSYAQFIPESHIKSRKEKLAKTRGKNNHLKKPFMIINQKFYTLKEASDSLGVPKDTIRMRLKNKSNLNYQYI